MDRESFVLHTKHYSIVRDLLTPEQKGILFDAINHYALGEDYEISDPAVKLAFGFYCNQMDYDFKRREQKQEAGREGGLSKRKQTQAKVSKSKQTKANVSKTNLNVNVNVNGNDDVNVNGDVNDDVNVNVEDKKELIRIKENNTLTRISDRTQSFFDWLEINCPYVFGHLKLPTDAQFDTLVERYGKNMIAEQCMQIENRADLRKKYKVLFPTLNNWCKRELKSSNQAEYEQQQRLLQYAEVAADFLNQSEMGEQGAISPVIPF